MSAVGPLINVVIIRQAGGGVPVANTKDQEWIGIGGEWTSYAAVVLIR